MSAAVGKMTASSANKVFACRRRLLLLLVRQLASWLEGAFYFALGCARLLWVG